VLIDDLEFFPPYNAAPLVRGVVLRQHPELRAVLQRLAFAIDDRTMIELNFAVEEDGRAFGDVAREFLQRGGMLATGPGDPPAGDPAADDPTAGNPGDPAAGNTGDTAAGDPAAGNPAARSPLARGRQTLGQFISSRIGITLKLIGQHLYLSLVAVLLATLLAVPLGIAIRSRRAAERIAMGIAGVLQTIPSLALLVFMIALPGLGLSARSAIAALFLYALLPILRNTVTGIRGVDADLISAATGMGLTPRQILYRVQLPLAMPTIMAGLRTATVISIGVATLAAFIGAGGLGQPINEGLYLNDTRLILAGAIPAALLALVADWALGRVERRLRPRGMKDA